MPGNALIIGNSDGIGLAATIELRKRGWEVVGISRSESTIKDPTYKHIVTDVRDAGFVTHLKPIRYSAPWIVIPLVKFRGWIMKLSICTK